VTDAASPAGQSMMYSFAVFPGSQPAGELGPWLAVDACGEHRRSRQMSADRPAVRAHRSVGFDIVDGMAATAVQRSRPGGHTWAAWKSYRSAHCVVRRAVTLRRSLPPIGLTVPLIARAVQRTPAEDPPVGVRPSGVRRCRRQWPSFCPRERRAESWYPAAFGGGCAAWVHGTMTDGHRNRPLARTRSAV
jgi:hypothetical protein